MNRGSTVRTLQSRRALFEEPREKTAEAAARLVVRGSMRERAQAMRSPRNPRPVGHKAVPAPPSAAIIALSRMGFGQRPGDVTAFNVLGSTDQERLLAYVNQQLDPASIDDSAADAKISAAGLTTINKSLEQLWQDHAANSPPWSERMRPYWETELLTFLRGVHSRRQLVEVLADFWHNHFNVYAPESWVAPVMVHYDRDVIRGNMLGNFRQMLEDVATSPAMLYYLDNYTSTNAGPNENFARELIELHGLGAENYMGVMQQHQVPQDLNGVPVAYVDADVYEATRCFTGWTFDFDTGLFQYRDDWHDRFQKTVLGVFMPADQPALADGRDVLDAIADHPGTGRYIARKLCRRLIGDNPPQAVVDAAATVFTANTQASDQLTQVVRTILLHDEFLATWAEKIKRPFEIAVSAMRATQAEMPFVYDDSDINSFFYRYDSAGQPLFQWRAPNGYADYKEDWQSASPRVMSWRLCNWLIDADDDNGNFYLDLLGQTPLQLRTANELADYWIVRILGRAMPAAERAEIVDFMAQGHNPDFDLPLDSDDGTRDRLRSMVGLILMSPSFLWR